MHTGFLDMFHDTGDHHSTAVADCIRIDLNGVGEIFVDQHRVLVATLSLPTPCIPASLPHRRQSAWSVPPAHRTAAP